MVVYSELTKESNPGLPLGVILLALWNITSCTSFCIHLPCSFRAPGPLTTPGLRGVVIPGLTRRNDTRFPSWLVWVGYCTIVMYFESHQKMFTGRDSRR
ncbi:hypothetical protein V8C43DRAFT_267267 [Trichoderma afarasin]